MSPFPAAIPVPRTLRLIDILGLSLIDLAVKAIAFESRMCMHGSSCISMSKSQFKAASSAWLHVEGSVPRQCGIQPALTAKGTACRVCQSSSISSKSS